MPGVIVTLVLVIIVNLTAFAIVREREAGTLEQTMVSPIRPAEFIFGKTVPFFFVGLSEVAVVVAGGLFWFQIPSTVCSTQQQALSKLAADTFAACASDGKGRSRLGGSRAELLTTG